MQDEGVLNPQSTILLTRCSAVEKMQIWNLAAMNHVYGIRFLYRFCNMDTFSLIMGQ
jgi:hypothetical protein